LAFLFQIYFKFLVGDASFELPTPALQQAKVNVDFGLSVERAEIPLRAIC
jgi:hypothetical protein